MTRLEIMQKITPRFDYNVYVQNCRENGFDARPRGTWAQLMGMLSAAEVEYPDKPIDEAYTLFLENSAKEHAEAIPTIPKTGLPVTTGKCGSCGGGEVR